jgi:DNA-binding GntR family transcriptional regulator
VVQSASLKPSTVMLEGPVIVPWEEPFFYELSPAEEAVDCVRLVRLRKVGGQPVMLEYTFFPNMGLDGIDDNPLINNSLFGTLVSRYGIEVEKVNQDVRAISAVGQHARMLGVKDGAPLLHIYRKYETSQSGFHIYSSLYCDTANYTIGNLFN